MTENQSIVYQLERTACQSERTACQPELVSGSTPDCIDEMLKRVQHDKIGNLVGQRKINATLVNLNLFQVLMRM
jgi:hypothetical protein